MRASLGVGNSHDPNVLGSFHVEDQVREAFQHVLSEPRVVMPGPHLRLLLNLLNCLLDLGVEIQAQS